MFKELRSYVYVVIASLLRLYLIDEGKLNDFKTVGTWWTTPLNSFNRVVDGAALVKQGINPYDGDLYHETPFELVTFNWLLANVTLFQMRLIYILCEIVTSVILYFTALRHLNHLYKRQESEKSEYANDVGDYLLSKEECEEQAKCVALLYLFNPYSIASCSALATSTFSNLWLSIVLFSLVHGMETLCCFALAVCTLDSFYPVILIGPLVLRFGRPRDFSSLFKCLRILAQYSIFACALVYWSYRIVGNWSFLNGTIGFILTVPDLKPNVGLFWYFFTEMFEHFRPLFTWAFQINATVLFSLPLCIRLRNDAFLCSLFLIALTTVFKSYPSIGDFGFYISLLPTWNFLFPHMQQKFLAICLLIGTSVIAPIVWHLWIYSGSANANFYFGITLAFATLQIFFITDLLFAYIKWEFTLKFGTSRQINGKPAKLIMS